MTPTNPPDRSSPPARGRPGGRRPPPSVGGLAARRAALALIDAALARRGGMEDMDEAGLAGLDSRDRGFARALALGTLRWLGPIDRALSGRLRKPPPTAVTRLLRLGAAQMMALDTPPHAAVSTTLALAAPSPEARAFVKLINAVLRSLDRDRPLATPEQFAPDWLFARWRAAYGADIALKIAARIIEEPQTDLSLRDALDADAVADAVGGIVLPGATVRTERKGDVSQWPGFAEGRWWVQDAAAALPARLLGAKAGETALDLCAAPGGKTMQLAAAGAQVVALDRSEARLSRLRDNLLRTGLEAELVAADARTWDDGRTFDKVLLDAPCSATGTFRRHPDVLWTTRAPEIAALAEGQAKLLDAAARRLRPGGRLVYCVCALEPEEGEAQVAPFLSRHPHMALEPIAAGEEGAPGAAVRPDGTLRLLPSEDLPLGGLDGFFIARFQRML